MADVILKDIDKVYPNGFHAVKKANIEIKDKEFVVLLGPSGCGKSTTLRMIAGLEDISSGELKINEKVVNDVEPKDRDIAMVFQNYALYPHMSIYENMAFGLRLRKMPKDEIDKKVKEAARILDIESLLDRKPKQLSGGQRQRVAVGRAIVRDPKVFLFDEPLSNLDAKLRVQMRSELKKLHISLKATIIYVTHDQVEAMTMADKIVIMKDGFIQQIGDPFEVYHHPANIFVAGFIGTPAMNFINVKVSKEKDGIWLKENGVEIKVPKNYESHFDNYIGKGVVFGIRPEDIYDKEHFAKNQEGNVVNANVDVAEPLGAETLLHIDIKGQNITAKVEPTTKAKTGDQIEIQFDLEKMHAFDTETQLAIF
ncbi:MAG: sn-glycerol-3-phosphate ABC transporter ATP-binding protein UgpC [Thermotogae bacterium]|nr:sn-glycerol-3-phosphate ABC transporter ATP-binding protein UgpC [Thermotogota bacterium]